MKKIRCGLGHCLRQGWGMISVSLPLADKTDKQQELHSPEHTQNNTLQKQSIH